MIAREGFPFIGVAIVCTAVCAWLFWPVALFFGLLAAFFINFFRDPERSVPAGDNVVSPADGHVIVVKSLSPAENDGFTTFVSIFMNVFDVHVNRAPISGRITECRHVSGLFLPAYEERAPFENERNIVVLEGPQGRVKFAQVAGILARRIVFRRAAGDNVAKGERIGMIRFGSRLDVWLPAGLEVVVQPKQRVLAAKTILARKNTENGNNH